MKLTLLLLLIALACANANVYVRVSHAAVQAPAVDIKANGSTIFTNLAYPTITPYLLVPPGAYEVEILAHGTNTSLLKMPATIEEGKSYTFVATGNPTHNDSTFAVVSLVDDRSNPADQYTARVRAFHGIADVPDAQILLDGAAVAELTYKQASAYLNVAAGAHTLTIKRKVGDAFSEVFTEQVTFTGGTVYTAFAEGLFNDSGANNIAVAAAADAVFQYLTARVAHASATTGAVDVYVKDDVDMVSTKIVTAIAFQQFSPYYTIAFEPVKNYSVFVTETGKTQPIYTVTPTFADGLVVTAAAIGVLSNATTTPFRIQFIDDPNPPPTNPDTANLKFVHTIPGALPASLVMGSQTIFTNVEYGTSSLQTTVSAGTFTFHVVVNGSTIVTKDVTLARGGVYSFYAEGSATTSSLVVATDATYTYATVRASHASPESPNVDIVFRDVHGNEIQRFSNVAYEQTTDYATIVLQTMTVNVEVGGNALVSDPITFVQDTDNTVIVLGTTNMNFTERLSVSSVQDNNAYPANSQTAHIRFAHAVVGAGPVNVLAGETVLFTQVAFKQVTGYKMDLAQGTYTINVVAGNVPVLSFTQFFTGGNVYTIFAEGEAGAHSKVAPKQVVSQDAAYQYTTLRIAHASADAPAVDVHLNDGNGNVVSFNNLAYGGITQYQEIVLFNYTLQITPTGANNVIFSKYFPLNQNMVYTGAVIGLTKENTTTSLDAVAFSDDQTIPSNSYTGRGRFVHAVADGAPHVDVYFNDQLRFTNIAYGQATDYINVDAKSYRVDVYKTGTEDKIATTDIKVGGGQVFTLFAEGTTAKIDAKMFADFAVEFFRLRVAQASPDVGAVDVLVEGQTVWSGVAFTSITSFQEFTSNQKNVTIVNNGKLVLQTDTKFPVNQDSTLIVVGLTAVNTTTPVEAVIVSDKTTVPSSNQVANVRISHVSPGSPTLNVQINGTVQFTDVAYKATTAYKQFAAGDYVLESNTTHGLIKGPFVLKGGLSYTLFLEGTFPTVTVVQEIDYFPPSDARVRFFHASPDTAPVDFLINGSADIRNVEFTKASEYVTTIDGETDFNVVPTGQLKPFLIDTSSVLAQSTDYSFFLVGFSNHTNTTHHLGSFVLTDDNSLPADGKVKIRFVHASPDAPAVDVKFSGNAAPVFMNVTYQEGTKYVTIDANIYDLEVSATGKPDVAATARFDLRVATGSAVYTLVAEGLLEKLNVIAFLDNGSAPPADHSSSKHKKGLSGLAIGLIIGGVAVGVILLAAIGFIVYKKRRERAGYSEIASKE